LATVIDWFEFEQSFGKFYSPDQGRPGKPIRLMVGLHYLKHTFDLSDEEAVTRWVENPYWQYFCGEQFEPSLMTKWRNKVKDRGLEKLLEMTIKTGLKMRALKLALTLRRWFKRRGVVEAVISHSKNECRLARNYLLGSEGDRVNAILCGCGYNIRRLLRAFIFWLWKILLIRRLCYRGALVTMVAKQF